MATEMKPLTVRYVHDRTDWKERTFVMTDPHQLERIDILRTYVMDGSADDVTLVGPGMATGWRIVVERPIHFETTDAYVRDDDRGRTERQAAFRIVNGDEPQVHVVSPLRTIQELVPKDMHYPWRVMVTCSLLNQTHGRGVRPMIDKFFETWPDPDTFMRAALDQVYTLIQPLGFGNRRTSGLKRMTQDYRMLKRWQECYGVGPYALDALDLFAIGKTNVRPADTWLVPYLAWREAGGPQVFWDKEGHAAWRQEMKNIGHAPAGA